MKNKFLFLAMFFGGILFSACNDDDNSPKDFNGIYSSVGDNVLNLRYSGADFVGKSVEFDSVDGAKASLKLLGVVPGEKETVVSDMELVKGEGEVYSFTVEDKNEVRTVNLKGSVEKGKLILDVNVKFAQNELLGKWNVPVTGGVHLVWEPSGLKLPVELANGKTYDLPISLVTSFGKNILSAKLREYLQNVTFKEDGNIIATYNAAVATEEAPKPEADWKESALNLAHYKMQEDVCYVFPNVEMIMRQVQMDGAGRANNSSDPTLGVLQQLLSAGIPVHKGETEEGKLNLYIDKELVDKLVPLLPLVSGLIPDDAVISISFLSVKVKSLVESLPEVLEQTTRLEIGLNLVAAE